MPTKSNLSSPLAAKVIALSESRQLDVLAALCERRQATVIRVPLISIQDSPDQDSVLSWLEKFTADPPDYFIILTGEGLRRLLAAANRAGLEAAFIDALGQSRKVCRGPKPDRVLREINLQADLLGTEATTAGIIKSLEDLELRGTSVAVQLYGEDPNQKLADYLHTRVVQSYWPVAPYIYISNSEAEKVEQLILDMVAGKIDFIAFTSQAQVKRIFTVAKEADLQAQLRIGLEKTKVAAVGPIVGELLSSFDCKVSVMPDSSYFMKPLVRAMEQQALAV